ncbi:MAG TPA: dihydropyrimidine dehydrogenase subunit A, partial [Proteobacteria bacterium]|nr:dihydropyrimidine dehydrogenase subunit A [Pseudomonadota bacterium]
MAKVIFSCWRGEVIDNRSKEPSEIPEIEAKDFPFTLGDSEPRAFVGWDGFVICQPDVNIVELMRAYFEEVQSKASCGQCFPCRVGTRVLAEMLGRIVDGRGKPEDIAKIERLARHIKASSKCQVGQTSPVPLLLALEHYRDEFEKQIAEPKRIERVKLTSHLTAPCSDACPAHVDIPTYIEHIRNYRFAESLEVIRERGIIAGCLGRVCVRPCESNCRRTLIDEPIAIKPLKRHVADQEVFHERMPRYRRGPRRSGRVAIIGAGPAGLSCGFRLAVRGYDVTIYEALPVAGGMAAVGIPPYRLPRDILNR